jgi:hypothetical protein
MTEEQRDFRITGGKGFQLDMLNGVTVSVQWGPGNYCDRNNAGFDAPGKTAAAGEEWGSNLAECAAFITGSELTWVAVPGYTDAGSPFGGDDVYGYLNVSQVLDFINLASKLAPQGDYRDDPKIQEDERKVMDEFAIDEYFSNKESNDEDIA